MKRIWTILSAFILLILSASCVYASDNDAQHNIDINVNHTQNSITLTSADESISGTLIHASYTDKILNKVKIYDLNEDILEFMNVR